MSEKLFSVVGTAINPDGTIKVRWATDLVSRIKILDKAKCSGIDLIELPNDMTKLEAAEYFLANKQGLSPAQTEILEIKIAEKTRTAKRNAVTATLTENVQARVDNNTPTDPRVEKFIEDNTLAE